MPAADLLTLIQNTQSHPNDPALWRALTEALEARGQKAEAEFCRWRETACIQNPQDESKALFTATLKQAMLHAQLKSSEPLRPFHQAQDVIPPLLDRLLTGSEDEAHLAARLLLLFTTLEVHRLNALDILARQSWARIAADLSAQTTISRVAALWAALFRAYPKEMSHALLSAGMTVHPTTPENPAWFAFKKVISQLLGRGVDVIINEQIPDLP
jgi:hypothetical protein